MPNNYHNSIQNKCSSNNNNNNNNINNLQKIMLKIIKNIMHNLWINKILNNNNYNKNCHLKFLNHNKEIQLIYCLRLINTKCNNNSNNKYKKKICFSPLGKIKFLLITLKNKCTCRRLIIRLRWIIYFFFMNFF